MSRQRSTAKRKEYRGCIAALNTQAESARCVGDITMSLTRGYHYVCLLAPLNCSLPVLLPAHEVELQMLQRINGLT
jgi:hypothetical protein